MTQRDRREILRAWYESTADVGATRLSLVAGDGGLRRYYRAKTAQFSAVLCDSPPATEKNAEFLHIARALTEAGVRVPRVYHADLRRGFFALEDLGQQTLLAQLNETSVDGYYAKALAVLRQLALADPRPFALANYDYRRLAAEMALFPEWFCAKLLKRPLNACAEAAFAALNEALCQRALAQTQVVVHRDFHARNLMVLAGGELACIDFQDAVLGPVTYDAVSLLRDGYVRWPAHRVRGWARNFRQALISGGLSVGEEPAFLIDFDWMGLQRHIKVLGIFARLYLRDGKAAYLRDLPRVLAYLSDVLAAYADEPALADFARWFEGEILPAARRQAWHAALLDGRAGAE